MTTILEHVNSSVGTKIGRGTDGASVLLVQRGLQAAGQILFLDGEFGPNTELAVKRFQADNKLNVVGYVGPKTAALLDAALVSPLVPKPIALPSVLKVAPHLATMRAITGLKEIPGAADNPFITVEMVNTIGRAFPDMANYARNESHDSVPWCGHTVGYCLAKNGLRPVFGRSDTEKYLWADAWAHEGPELIKLKAPYPQGAIMVYSRAGGGHVSLLEESGDGWDNIRGGNQSDMVNVVAKSRDQFTAATWPRALPIPSIAAPRAKVRGAVSASER